jgi:hypothetical protein
LSHTDVFLSVRGEIYYPRTRGQNKNSYNVVYDPQCSRMYRRVRLTIVYFRKSAGQSKCGSATSL